MEGFIIVIALVVIFLVFILPAIVFRLSGKVERLEEEIFALRAELRRPSQEEESRREEKAQASPRSLLVEERPVRELEKGSSLVVSPPALPPEVVEEKLVEEAVENVVEEGPSFDSALPKVLPLSRKTSPVSEWFEKIGLKPPGAEEELSLIHI